MINTIFQMSTKSKIKIKKMNVDCKHEYISLEEKVKTIYIHLFRFGKYLTTNSMYESRKLKWSRRIFMILMIIINYIIRSKVIENIQVHLEAKAVRKSKSKMHWVSWRKLYIFKKNLEHSTWRIFSWCIKNNYRQLIKKARICILSAKLKIKNLELRKETKYNWCLSHINWNFINGVFFSDECTFYLKNPSASRWVKIKRKV